MYETTEDTLALTLGIIGLSLVIIANSSQIYHNIKYKKVNGISIIFIISQITLTILFLVYGIFLKLIIIIILNVRHLCCALIMLYYWKYGVKNHKSSQISNDWYPPINNRALK